VATGIQLIESLQVLNHYTPRPGARTTTDADDEEFAQADWNFDKFDGNGPSKLATPMT
jgi:hypothetical protein